MCPAHNQERGSCKRGRGVDTHTITDETQGGGKTDTALGLGGAGVAGSSHMQRAQACEAEAVAPSLRATRPGARRLTVRRCSVSLPVSRVRLQ